GGSEQRAYPWSSPPSSLLIDGSHTAWSGSAVQQVGATPAGNGRWGHADLAGNVFEMVHDYMFVYYDYPPNPCVDCVNTDSSSGNGIVIRGGEFDAQGEYYQRSGYRGEVAINERLYGMGARCARPK